MDFTHHSLLTLNQSIEHCNAMKLGNILTVHVCRHLVRPCAHRPLQNMQDARFLSTISSHDATDSLFALIFSGLFNDVFE